MQTPLPRMHRPQAQASALGRRNTKLKREARTYKVGRHNIRTFKQPPLRLLQKHEQPQHEQPPLPPKTSACQHLRQLIMATYKRSRPDTEDAPRLSSADNDSPTASANNSGLATTSKRARQSAPIDKILNVVELCEQVLSHLPLFDLLQATQVCRTFKKTIDNSHRLQKNLFLAPDLPRPRLAISSSDALLSGTRAAQHIAAAEAAGAPETGEFTCCTPHSALQLDPESHRIVAVARKYKGMVAYAADRFHPSNMCTNDSMIVRDPIRSWTENGTNPSGLDSMLITQPPVTSVHLELPGARKFKADREVANRTGGVTFGDVFKTFKRIAPGHSLTYLREWWISFDSRTFVVSAEARVAVERAGELSSEDDPTRWVRKNREYVLKEGGFEFV